MKTKTFLIILIVMLSNIVLFAQSKKVDVTVDLRGTDCDGGSGFCGVMRNSSKSEKNAKVYLNIKGMLVMEINYTKLPINELENLIGEPFNSIEPLYYFVMDDSFTIDSEIQDALGLPNRTFEIPKDVYLAIVEGEIIKITMPLVKIEPNDNPQKE